ncbi:WD40-repeat-containing domain protein [Melanogaster broomeanus]|nr:WD40-repeat-containing domain protein [Melanogaster broomeanus]
MSRSPIPSSSTPSHTPASSRPPSASRRHSARSHRSTSSQRPGESKVKEIGPSAAKTFAGHKDIVWSVLFVPDAGQIVSASEDGTIRVWDMESGEEVGDAMKGHKGPVCSIVMLADGKRIASAGADKSIRIWDLEERKPEGEPLQGHSDVVRSIDISPNGRYLASGSFDHTVKIWDCDTREIVQGSIKCDDRVYFVKFSRDGLKLATGSGDGLVRTWKWDTGEELVGPMGGHEGTVRSVLWTISLPYKWPSHIPMISTASYQPRSNPPTPIERLPSAIFVSNNPTSQRDSNTSAIKYGGHVFSVNSLGEVKQGGRSRDLWVGPFSVVLTGVLEIVRCREIWSKRIQGDRVAKYIDGNRERGQQEGQPEREAQQVQQDGRVECSDEEEDPRTV